MHTGVTVYPYSNYRAGMNMYTSGYANRSTSLSSTAGTVAQNTVGGASTGLISEVVYREDQPLLTQLLLLPLLQQLGQQSRWQLWLTPQQKLSREWVQSAGLPLTKVMQINPAIQQEIPALWQQFRDASDMRNILTHEYFRVDAAIVWTTVHDSLPLLETQLRELVPDSHPSQKGQ